MSRRSKASPILALASEVIGNASERLVPRDSRFHHSFEAELGRIQADPDQPRKHFDQTELLSLARTMAEQGQLQPILLRRSDSEASRWVIVAGERRWRAAGLNGWTTILAIEHDGDPEVAALLENLQRVDLAPQEEAAALHRLIAIKGWSQAVAATALGRSKAEISATLRILTLPPELLEVLTSEHPVSRNVLIELARVDDPATRDRLAARANTGSLTIRAIRDAQALPLARPALPRPTVARQVQVDFSYHQVESLAHELQCQRLAGKVPTLPERARLGQLRREIDALLRDNR